MTKSKTIVLVHGNFVNDLTWQSWKRHYEQKGYTVYTPANPGHGGNPAELRKNMHPKLIQTGFREVVTHISELIDTLPEKPLVIGHSMAGMAVMKLAEAGKVAAAVSLDGAPPKNVLPPFSTIRTVFSAFGFFSAKGYFMGSRKWYNHAFFNTLPSEQQEKMFDQFAVPESHKVNRQLVLDSFSAIDFKKPHIPLLFIGGGSDHIFPASLTRTIAGKYSDKNSRTDLKIYPGKSHFIAGEPGWEVIADDILAWYENL
ncbi:MAG: alpha/beta hydrolase [Leadbetterella sp.]|nr:alpha/beta hydrolase [Leadbetterella sp.]